MRTLAIALLLGISSAANAAQVCDDAHSVAETIMKARQAGVSASRLNSILPESSPNARRMVIEAYEMPFVGNVDDGLRREVISEFANRFFIECLKEQ